MSANNVMDVFLSVKVDSDEVSDLRNVLDVLEKISQNQSKIQASGGKIKIEADTKSLETKLDDIKKTVENVDPTLSDNVRQIKNNTDYIISRLWSVFSPTASKEQMLSRYANLGIGKNADEWINKFMSRMANPEILATRWGTQAEGEKQMKTMMTTVLGKIVEDLQAGRMTGATISSIETVEAMAGNRALSAPVLNKLVSLATGMEQVFQLQQTGITKGSFRDTDVSTSVLQRFVGRTTTGANAFKTAIGGRDPYKMSPDLRERVIRSASGTSKERATVMSDILADIDFTKYFIDYGTILPFGDEAKDLLMKKLDAEGLGAMKSSYAQRIEPDEITQISRDLANEFLQTSDKDAWKTKVANEFKSLGYSDKYSNLIAENFAQFLSTADPKLFGKDWVSTMTEWKIRAMQGQRQGTAERYGFDPMAVYLAAATNPQQVERTSLFTPTTNVDFDQAVEDLEKLRQDPNSQILVALSNGFRNMMDALKNGASKDDLKNIAEDLKDAMGDLYT